MKAKAVRKKADASAPIETKPTIFPVLTFTETVSNLSPLSLFGSETDFDGLLGIT